MGHDDLHRAARRFQKPAAGLPLLVGRGPFARRAHQQVMPHGNDNLADDRQVHFVHKHVQRDDDGALDGVFRGHDAHRDPAAVHRRQKLRNVPNGTSSAVAAEGPWAPLPMPPPVPPTAAADG